MSFPVEAGQQSDAQRRASCTHHGIWRDWHAGEAFSSPSSLRHLMLAAPFHPPGASDANFAQVCSAVSE